MSTVKELVLSPAGTEAEPPVAGLDEVPALAEAAADAEVGEDAEVVDVDERGVAARGLDIDVRDARVRVGAAQERCVEHTGNLHVVDIGPGAAHQHRIFAALDSRAD